MKFVGSIAAAASALLLSGAVARADTPDRVRTVGGVVEGLGPQPTGVREFRGIPFAAPPVGPLRWREPRPATPWTGVRDAKAFGPRCMQQPVFSDMMFRSNGVSEDCLYLNVWTPAKAPGERLPVLVYFYGGGFIAGDGSELRYDGESMARKGIVVVTLSYRLGVFGFLAHPELTAESPHHASGNYGLLDQTAALAWVRRNIGGFGGDPARVTIAGESAGSFSVSAQMASPLAKGLFARAIGESGSLLGLEPPLPLGEAERRGAVFAAGMGAKSLAELRAIPAETLLASAGKPGAADAEAVVDGWFLPRPPREIFASGAQSHVPLLAGANSQEQPPEGVLGQAPPTVQAYRAALGRLYGDGADRVFAVYPASADGEPVLDAARDLASDRWLGYATWKWLDMATRTGGEPTWAYYFAQARPATRADPTAPRPAGSVHSGEIEYVLGNLDLNPVYAWTPEDYATSAAAQAYFARFIQTGDPNGPGLAPWPTYDQGRRMRLDPRPRDEPDPFRARQPVLEQVQPR